MTEIPVQNLAQVLNCTLNKLLKDSVRSNDSKLDASSVGLGGTVEQLQYLLSLQLQESVNKLVQQNIELLKEMSSLKEQHGAIVTSLNGKIDALAMELSETRTAVGQVHIALETTEDALQLACQEREELLESTKKLDQQKDVLMVELSGVKEQYGTTSVNLSGKIDTLTAQLDETRAHVQQLHCSVDEAKKTAKLGQQAVLVSELSSLEAAVDLSDTIPTLLSELVPAVWKSSNTVALSSEKEKRSTELLQCPVLRAGIHKWSILVEDVCPSGLHLGVASTVHPLKLDKFIGYQEAGWVLEDSGCTFHNWPISSMGNPTFKMGSKVTFVLDLTGEGTLSASVDDTRPPSKLFSKMLSDFKGRDAAGFLPAVSLRRPGRVRFLGFE
jgi:uncharacterized protein YqgV (UPF0045/DUF77 family)